MTFKMKEDCLGYKVPWPSLCRCLSIISLSQPLSPSPPWTKLVLGYCIYADIKGLSAEYLRLSKVSSFTLGTGHNTALMHHLILSFLLFYFLPLWFIQLHFLLIHFKETDVSETDMCHEQSIRLLLLMACVSSWCRLIIAVAWASRSVNPHPSQTLVSKMTES